MNQNQPTFNYGEALQKSNLFYLAQRSGDLPDDYTIPWRDDSALNDGADVGRDLTGGYYDAGDHVKFGFPMAASMTMLSWGVIEYSEGYKKVNQLDETLDNIRWGTDYILKAYDDKGTENISDDIFWGQVGSGQVDHAYWGAPEDMTMARPAFKVDAQNPGSDLTGESAAALASASIVFRSTDEAYADKLLQKAEQLYKFAEAFQGAYTNSITDAGAFYNSWSGYQDELAWGAVWLHKAIEATGKTDSQYLDKAESYYNGISPGWTHNWDDKSYGTGILLAQETGKSKYKQDVEAWLDNWANPNGGIQKTNGGLAWLSQWGSLRYAANTAFLAGVYGDTVNDKGGFYTDFAESQINYILGDNPNNFSYMVGFGDNYPLNPHHRAASGTTNIGNPDSNKYTLYGALVGGPSAPNDNAYQDQRTDFIANEVALDYNAAFTGALARMTENFGGEALTEIPGINLGGNSNASDSGGGDNPDGEDNASDSGGGENPDGEDNPSDSGGDENPDGEDNPSDSGNGGDNPDGVSGTEQDISFSVVDEWGDGFTGNIKITNNSNQAINGWELGFTATFEIKHIWNADIESRQGNKYVIKDVGWNGLIAPGASVEFGFNGSNSDDINLAVDNVELNGVGNTTNLAVLASAGNNPNDSSDSGNPDGEYNPTDSGAGGNYNAEDNSTDSGTGDNPDGDSGTEQDVSFSVVNEWGNGFTGNIKITNNGNQPMNGWELELNATFDIEHIWNGSIESHEGNKYVIKDVGWNALIAPGASVEFGFNGSNSDDINLAVDNVELNGIVDASSPTEPVNGGNNPTDTDTVVNIAENPTDAVDTVTGLTDSKILVGEEYKGEGTFYGATGAGHCSLDAAEPGEPLMFAAMNAEQYDNSEACGAYVEVSGPKQEEGAEPIIVKIVDECPECQPGDLDLSLEAFGLIADPNDGRVPISWHLVNPGKTDPIIYHSKEGSTNEYWTAIQIRNSNAPISMLEMQEDDGSWTELKREPYNYFIDSDGVGAGEQTFRITNTLGQTIVETFEPAIGGQDVVSQFQFSSDPFPTPSI